MTAPIGDQGFVAIPNFVWKMYSKKPAPLVLYCLLRYRADNATGESWYSHESLADDLGVDVRTILRWQKQLEQDKVITVTRRFNEIGRKTSNLYKVVGVLDTTIVSHLEATEMSYELTNNALLDSSQVDTKNKNNEMFDEFYRAYPKRVNKGRAKKAWAKAIKKVPGEYILDKAKAYADDPNREQNEQFIPGPSRWLDDEAWENPPCKPKQNGRRRSGEEAEALERGQAELNKIMERIQREKE